MLTTVEHSEFVVLFHRGAADKTGTAFDSYSRFRMRKEADAQCSTQMAERSVEQRRAGVFFSVATRSRIVKEESAVLLTIRSFYG
jgi:hypothetical protein